MGNLRVALLGSTNVSLQGIPLCISAKKSFALLCYLAVQGSPVSKDEVTELLWGLDGANNFRVALHGLRALPGADEWLELGSQLRLHAATDLADFEAALQTARYGEALAHWGDTAAGADGSGFMQDFTLKKAPAFNDWLEVERSRVGALYLECLQHRAEELERGQKYEEALDLYRKLLDEDPLDEGVHREVMRLEWLHGHPQTALKQFDSCRRVLAAELGLEPVSATVALYEAIHEQASPATAHQVLEGYSHNVLTFVGREQELDELATLLSEQRMVTLLGPGGIGKTRLAHEVIRQKSATTRRAFFVPLQALRDATFMVAAIANAMQLSFKGPADPLEQLLTTLRGEPTLLVLDNLEHLSAVSELIETLLHASPVVILATSRRALGLSAELRFKLEGLAFPADDQEPAGASTDAVRLFVTAAHNVDPSFSLSPENRSIVFHICRLLHGHPLGLELAAGWLRLYDCRTLATKLDKTLLQLENPGLPLDERHSSLRLVMERSWTLLNEREKDVLAKLSVFRDGFDGQAARAIAKADLKTLTSLIDQSLLRTSTGGRYDLHPLIHEFAGEKLLTLPEHETTRGHHARYFLQRLSTQQEAILDSGPGPALAAIETDFENIREAWQQASRLGWQEELVAAAAALSLFTDMRVRFREAIDLFGEARAALETRSPTPATSKAILLGEEAFHLHRLSRHDEALALTELALSNINAESETEDSATEDRALHRLLRLKAGIFWRTGKYPESKDMFSGVLELSRDSLPDHLSRDLRSLANLELCMGQYHEAEAHYLEAIALDVANGYLIGRAINLNNLAELLILTSRLDEAEKAIEESLGYAKGVDIHLEPYLRLNKGELAYRRGDLAAATNEARACQEQAKDYAQTSLHSLSATLLARVDLEQAKLTSARHHLAYAINIAFEAQELTSLMHAFVAQGEFALAEGDDERAARYLCCASHHPASEFSVKTKAERLLQHLGAAEGNPLSVKTLVSRAT